MHLTSISIKFLGLKMTQKIKTQDMIPEILNRVEKLVDFALDVVDMAEECRDPDMPYYSV